MTTARSAGSWKRENIPGLTDKRDSTIEEPAEAQPKKPTSSASAGRIQLAGGALPGPQAGKAAGRRSWLEQLARVMSFAERSDLRHH